MRGEFLSRLKASHWGVVAILIGSTAFLLYAWWVQPGRTPRTRCMAVYLVGLSSAMSQGLVGSLGRHAPVSCVVPVELGMRAFLHGQDVGGHGDQAEDEGGCQRPPAGPRREV